MHRSPTGNLVPLDLEIEATLRRNRAERRRKLLQDRTVASILEQETHFSDLLSPDSPSSRESATQLLEVITMAKEHDQRITQVVQYHNFSPALHVLKCKLTTSTTHIP